MRLNLPSCLAALACLVPLGTTASADTLTLRVADSFPAGHFVAEDATKTFMETAKKLGGGKIDFEYFPAQQLGKSSDMLRLTNSGVTDIGYVAPAFISDKMPLSAVAELPGSFSTACEGTKAYWSLAKDGIIAKEELEPNGVRLLFTVTLPPYQLFTSEHPIKTLDDAKDLKIRSSGGAMELTVSSIGAVPVRLSGPEIYEALSRGTVDGGLLAHSSILSYKLDSLVHYVTTGENFGSFVVNYVISEDRWNKLSPDVQEILEKAGEETTMKACALMDEASETDATRLKDGGVTLVELPASDKEKLETMFGSLGEEWAQQLDGRGKPGTEVLKAFHAALKE
ncbi:TRAP transporter substrate-binding protein DctP [Afifella sp. IM 167]|uniref:TRAP transporter substrate-binding protein n=1 Tax=Afifella sp. IM 167 TaxID=2033586 RepID=UPI001CCDE03B|nr:TRAP transporter substrate-binding protein DctP [Afifella sp. IM 167]MBZ8132370.1 C4-dicarboxylate ABC transporter [Afifella sp. IM 167]